MSRTLGLMLVGCAATLTAVTAPAAAQPSVGALPDASATPAPPDTAPGPGPSPGAAPEPSPGTGPGTEPSPGTGPGTEPSPGTGTGTAPAPVPNPTPLPTPTPRAAEPADTAFTVDPAQQGSLAGERDDLARETPAEAARAPLLPRPFQRPLLAVGYAATPALIYAFYEGTDAPWAGVPAVLLAPAVHWGSRRGWRAAISLVMQPVSAYAGFLMGIAATRSGCGDRNADLDCGHDVAWRGALVGYLTWAVADIFVVPDIKPQPLDDRRALGRASPAKISPARVSPFLTAAPLPAGEGARGTALGWVGTGLRGTF